MVVREAAQAGQRFDFANDFEPAARVLAGALLPRFERENAVHVPKDDGSDEQPKDLVAPCIEESCDRREAADLLRCFALAGRGRRELTLQLAKTLRLELLVFDELHHRSVLRERSRPRADRCRGGLDLRRQRQPVEPLSGKERETDLAGHHVGLREPERPQGHERKQERKSAHEWRRGQARLAFRPLEKRSGVGLVGGLAFDGLLADQRAQHGQLFAQDLA